MTSEIRQNYSGGGKEPMHFMRGGGAPPEIKQINSDGLMFLQFEY